MEIPYERSFASNYRAKYWSNKNNIKPEQVYRTSNKAYIFNCDKCNHHFSAKLSNISTNDTWCPYCYGDELCNDNKCDMCYNRSFANHPKSLQWSNLNEISPRFVLKGSRKKYLLNCDNCNHTYNIIINRILSENADCPYCFSKLCSDINCNTCYEKSFASHPKAMYWSSENKLNPRDVRKHSGKKYVFNCDKCNHTFNSYLNNISRDKSWCPYCSIANPLLCSNNNCIHCYERSFASHPMSKYWSDKNGVVPRSIFKGTDKKYLFTCNKCNTEFSKRPLSIKYGSWCPTCKNKTEKKLYKWLEKHYINIVFQVRYDWCKNPKTNSILPFDFEYNNILIELDGPQHFRQISNWRTPEEQNEMDKYKMRQAKDNNKHIIRINQETVLNNINNWKHRLTDYINELLLIHNIPSTRYIDIDSTYFE
jgi:very-short-patch-repair endonuclease